MEESSRAHFKEEIVEVVRHGIDAVFVGKQRAGANLESLNQEKKGYSKLGENLFRAIARVPIREHCFLFRCERNTISFLYA